jgi:hypothetical protein
MEPMFYFGPPTLKIFGRTSTPAEIGLLYPASHPVGSSLHANLAERLRSPERIRKGPRIGFDVTRW